MECPKCTGPMTGGFVVDYLPGGNRQVEKWVAGAPKQSFWHGVDITKESQIEVVTYRCDGCGYLESYAPRQE